MSKILFNTSSLIPHHQLCQKDYFPPKGLRRRLPPGLEWRSSDQCWWLKWATEGPQRFSPKHDFKTLFWSQLTPKISTKASYKIVLSRPPVVLELESHCQPFHPLDQGKHQLLSRMQANVFLLCLNNRLAQSDASRWRASISVSNVRLEVSFELVLHSLIISRDGLIV